MAFLRFTRDKRGYEHFQLVESSTKRGRTRTKVLFWFRTPPGVKVGREPFDLETRRALEAKYPSVVFDWKRILSTPIPSADAEKWRERRRDERAAKRARKAREQADAGVETPETIDVPSDLDVLQEPDTLPEPDALAEADTLPESDTLSESDALADPDAPEEPDAPEDQ